MRASVSKVLTLFAYTFGVSEDDEDDGDDDIIRNREEPVCFSPMGSGITAPVHHSRAATTGGALHTNASFKPALTTPVRDSGIAGRDYPAEIVLSLSK